MISLSQTRIQKTLKVQQAMNDVNDLINSVITMQLNSIQRQIATCSKITGQLLQNDLIAHMRSIPSLKLLVYQLILKLAQQTQLLYNVQNNTQDIRQNGYPLQQKTMNRIIMYDSAVRKALNSTKDMLQELSWTIPSNNNLRSSNSRSKTQKTIGQSRSNSSTNTASGKVKYYLKQLGNLITQYQNHIKNNPFIISLPVNNNQKQNNAYDQQGHTALIQHMEQVIAKKQDRIKQLLKQLQIGQLDRRTMQNFVKQSDIQKQQLQQQINKLVQQINRLNQQNDILQQQINVLNFQLTQQNIKNVLQPQQQKYQKQYDQQYIIQAQQRQILNGQSLQRMLLMQAMAVQYFLQKK